MAACQTVYTYTHNTSTYYCKKSENVGWKLQGSSKVYGIRDQRSPRGWDQ